MNSFSFEIDKDLSNQPVGEVWVMPKFNLAIG